MKLEQYIRAEINNKIIPLVKKDKCEICNSNENLEVHHVKPFAEILYETLNQLKLEYADTNKYTKKELNIITNIILGKHLKYKCITVCHDCHKNIIHKNGTSNIGKNGREIRKTYNLEKKYKKELIKNKNIKNQIQIKLIPYLTNITNKRIFKENKQKLINIINLKDDRGRQQKSISLINTYFKNNQIPFIINHNRDNKEKLDNGQKNPNFRKTYWIIINNK